ncbi:MAG TPA: hypothetical protein VFH97_05335 [Gemmatimonadales bacterium]|nr:hypothetical protein [Gemmatimonadales bacterium]
MDRELAIDRAVYLVDDRSRTYRFLRRNRAWRLLDRATSERNKRHIDGYTRVFRDGTTRTYRYRPGTTPRS